MNNPCSEDIPKLLFDLTMIVSLVTPGSTKSSIAGVMISFFPLVGFFMTKKIFEVPTSPIFP